MTSLSVGLHFNYVIAVRIYKHKLSGFKTSRWPPEFHRLLVCMSPATLVITVCSWQTISVLFLSLRQHSNFTLNFAAIIHTQTNFRVFLLKKTLKSSAMSWAIRICVLSLSGRANLVWACDDMVAYFSSGRFQLTTWQTVNTLFFIWVQKVTILWLVNK